MSLSEVAAWERHFAEYPPLHILLGHILGPIAVAFAGEKSEGEKFKLSDFLPWLRENPKTEQEEMDALLESMLGQK